MSSTWPSRARGISDVSAMFCWGYHDRSRLVSIRPGDTTLTRMLWGGEFRGQPPGQAHDAHLGCRNVGSLR